MSICHCSLIGNLNCLICLLTLGFCGCVCSLGLWSQAWSLAVLWHLTSISIGGTMSIKTGTEQRSKCGRSRETPPNQWPSYSTDPQSISQTKCAGGHRHGAAKKKQNKTRCAYMCSSPGRKQTCCWTNGTPFLLVLCLICAPANTFSHWNWAGLFWQGETEKTSHSYFKKHNM